MGIEFRAWPKTPRLFRGMTITEKIDGTNAAVVITPAEESTSQEKLTDYVSYGGYGYEVRAQSRKRTITPEDDNYGFAQWVRDNSGDIIDVLGPGRHFGEWWGHGIQRGYGLSKGERFFSLFNTSKWRGIDTDFELRCVPILYEGDWAEWAIDNSLYELTIEGSRAARGYYNPEGICVFHHAANQVFKVTLDGDGHKEAA